MKFLKLLFVFVISSSHVHAFDPIDFPPQSMKSAVASMEALAGKKVPHKITLVSATEGFSSVVEATGKSRKIAGKTIEFIKGYAKVSKKPAISESYADEVQVTQDGVQYWIPIQTAFAADLRKELRPGQKFIVYLVSIGKTTESDPVFLMNDFDSSKSDIEKLKLTP